MTHRWRAPCGRAMLRAMPRRASCASPAAAVLVILAVATAGVAILAGAGVASAHTLGLSVAEFDVTPEGPVSARITFASAEPLAGTPLRDGDLAAFVARGIDVTADGARCDGTFQGSSITETDGLELDARYACPAGAARIEVTLYYLDDLSPGHREVARIVASGASSEALLSSTRRAIALDIPGRAEAKAARERTGWRVVALEVAFLVWMAGIVAWRWRAARRVRPPPAPRVRSS